ncbi:MAG: 1-acyl-sn-glycerol-3-phosphate acyltransferase [Bacteroidota bacterium]
MPKGESEKKKKKNHKSYTPILSGTSDWPVVQLTKNRKEFVEEVTEESVKRLKAIKPSTEQLIEELELTLYKEKHRIKQNPWKVDPDDEYKFWSGIKSALVDISSGNGSESTPDDLLRSIVARYADEIAGDFRRSYYRLAREIVKFGFARLLNAARGKRFGDFFRNNYTLQDKIQIKGKKSHIRKLAKIGTVVMVPTHFSNMDSILIGWIIHVLGIPPFIYGAGLNLFNTKIFAYFMNSLGAYKVDRRKKNLIYLETLKTYSTLAIQKGAHSLFFPGGTRSRSGKIEKSLKLGLLGTAIEAQRINFMENPPDTAKKIFVVPVVINYNFVLEAPLLIDEYLERKGQERYYIETDRYSTSFGIIKFLIRFFTKGSDISVSIGQGMDLFGNYVDDEGNSIGKDGRIIDAREYFMSNGEVVLDKQREEQYTKLLSDAIVREYHRNNRVTASHLAAFTAFVVLRKRFPTMDLYNFLRLPPEDQIISAEEFKTAFKKLRKRIYELKDQDRINIAPSLKGPLDDVIDEGIRHVGRYHVKRPLLKNDNGEIITENLNTLYYYHNRTVGYNLEDYV